MAKYDKLITLDSLKTAITKLKSLISEKASKTDVDTSLAAKVSKSGDTMTGKLTAPKIETGADGASYFQCRKFRGEGDATKYYHAIDFGYQNHNQVDFYEYGGRWNFWICTSGVSTTVSSCGFINSGGWNGNVTGNLTGNASTATKATQDSDGNAINTTYMKAANAYTKTEADSKFATDTIVKHGTTSSGTPYQYYDAANGKLKGTPGTGAFAEGSNTTVSGVYSHAEGTNNTSSGIASHAEGDSSTASGTYSHTEGTATAASAMAAHAEGGHTIAASNYQHVEGKYNVSDSASTYAHIVGGGSSDSVRKNIYTLDWSGNGMYSGGLKVGGDAEITGSLKVGGESVYTKTEVDNLVNNAGGVVVSATAPSKTNVLWIDTGNGGIAKYYDTSSKAWTTVKSVWG